MAGGKALDSPNQEAGHPGQWFTPMTSGSGCALLPALRSGGGLGTWCSFVWTPGGLVLQRKY